MPSPEYYSQFIKSEASRLGFDYCGIAKAEYLEEEARKLENWLYQGRQGSMSYMENYFDKRVDPRKLLDGAKSMITLLLNYYPSQIQDKNVPKISKYAYGNDYHSVIKAKLKQLLMSIQENIGEVQGRGFVDSAPVLERAWAQKSGLGFIGKNGNLIHKGSGSYFFISTLIVDLELHYDDPMVKDYCGTCTKCLDACPTEAIVSPHEVDGSKCISYFTIELKDQIIPNEMKGKFQDWIFGCDICQDVCPWNKFSKPNNQQGFIPNPQILNFTSRDWENLTEENFKKFFYQSPLKRTKLKGIQRNLRFLIKKNHEEKLNPGKSPSE
ncbi:MAG: tRNA epoxyqueuosine(34) reductase QueG [Chitinophagaceae bacterium]